MNLYNTVCVEELRIKQFLAWFDNTIIDGIVNGSATLTKALSNFKWKI
jgi:hypothetical protein